MSIEVGDKVRIISDGGIFTTYMRWLMRDNIYWKVHDYLSHYQYEREPENWQDRVWTVVCIGSHGGYDAQVALIDDGEECYMFDIDHLQKVDDKPRMTNRELCRWLAEGKGEVLHDDQGKVGTWHSYGRTYDDVPVHESVKIRSWDEKEWREPLKERLDEDSIFSW